LGWFPSFLGGADKPEETAPGTSKPEAAMPAPSPSLPDTIRVTTSTAGLGATVKTDLSGCVQGTAPLDLGIGAGGGAAERKRREVARASKVRGKHFAEHVDEI
jgi:hypothetical protein